MKIIKDVTYLDKLIDIANACINIGHWPSHFKISTTIVIPKQNKNSYDSSKFYQSIVLLNIISKLFEKVIGERMQFLMISNNFIHPCQLGNLKQRSTINASIILTFFICIGWVRNKILNKASFDPKVSIFFHNYLVGRKTKYLWNNFSSLFFNVNIGIGQGLALLPILSVLYLSPFFYIFEKRLKILKIPIFIISFIDNNLLIFQNKSILNSNKNIFYSYNVISNLLTKFGLIIEYRKTEVFYFSRSQEEFAPSPLDLILLGETILYSKTT